MSDPYEDMALKAFPLGCRIPGIAKAREVLASWCRHAAEEAICRQREQEFPELASERAKLAQDRQSLENARKEQESWLDEQREALRRQEAGNAARKRLLQDCQDTLTRKIDALQALVAAFESWYGWQNGDGPVEENRVRYQALVAAWEKYKEQNP